MPGVPGLRRQEDDKFRVILGYKVNFEASQIFEILSQKIKKVIQSVLEYEYVEYTVHM